MPLYEFLCEGCGEKFEELILSSSEKITCPSCGEERVKRLMSPFTSRNSEGSSTSSSACGSCTSTSCSTCKL